MLNDVWGILHNSVVCAGKVLLLVGEFFRNSNRMPFKTYLELI